VYSWVAGNFRAHDPLTGTVLWEVNCDWNWNGWSMNTVPAIDDGKAFVEQPPNLVAIDLAARTNIWTAAGGVTGSPAVANGIVYAIVGDGVQAFSAQNGASLGFYEATNDTGVAWQPIVTDDALFVSSPSATYIFDLASYQLRQTIPYGGPLSLANGWLYIAGQDGELRAYTVSPTAPEILVQPFGQTVLGGSDVTFAVVASGTPPPNYFWQRNGAPLSGATNPSLTLMSVARTNSGGYNVIVSNILGCIASSNSALVVHVPQRLGAPMVLPDGALILSSRDADGGLLSQSDLAMLQPQVSSNLTKWVTLPGSLTLTNGALQFRDSGATNGPFRFYRIIENW